MALAPGGVIAYLQFHQFGWSLQFPIGPAELTEPSVVVRSNNNRNT
jgi:hypothetical protein